jgi:hypothetical protein
MSELKRALCMVLCAYSMPEIIFSYSSHHGTWFNFLASASSWAFFSIAAILVDN